MYRIDDKLTYYQFSGFEDVKHGVFTRHGGVSLAPFDSLNLGGTVGDDANHVQRNHELIYETLGVNGQKAVTVWMVHGAETVIAHEPLEGRRWLAQADAVITNQPDMPLVMRYADCTPIFAYDPVKRAIGAAHAGWRGTVMGMAYRLIEAMQKTYGSNPKDIRAGIGPAIGPDRYQVGEEVVKAVEAHFGTLDGLMKRDSADGTAYFNLWEANYRDLRRAGVTDAHIDVAGICTAERTDEFFSHRAENGKTGRFGTVISL